jgi:hypothetical protein
VYHDLGVNALSLLTRSSSTRLNERIIHTVAYFLKKKKRTVEPEKQPVLGDGSVTRINEVNAGRGVSCAVRTGAI